MSKREDSLQRWWRGAVLYEIYPISFCDSDGDGWGDLGGVRARVDHIARLGVDAVWLTPVHPSPRDDFGYDSTNFTDVDPLLGDLAGFDALVQAFHDAGIRVLLDQVYSHTSHRHPWFIDSRENPGGPHGDWYVWADARPDGSPPNNWQSMFGGSAWHWDHVRCQYYLSHFYPSMPHLNSRLPAVQDQLLDTARFWLERGVDGFRFDVANLYQHDALLRDNPAKPWEPPLRSPKEAQHCIHDYSQPENLAFVSRIRAVLDAYPGATSLAELTSDMAQAHVLDYVRQPDRFDTVYRVLAEAEPFTVDSVRRQVLAWQEDGVWPTWCVSNHDIVRGVTRCFGSDAPPAAAGLLVGLLACLRGNMLLFQGDELGLHHGDVPREALRDPEGIRSWPHGLRRDGARTPMPWSAGSPNLGFSAAAPWMWIDPRHRVQAVDLQEADAGSVLAETRRWIAARRGHPALRHGDIRFLAAPDTLLRFVRTTSSQQLECLFNFGPDPVTLDLDPAHPTIECSRMRRDGGAITLDGYGACIVRIA
jgi:alpha-glucosidase